MEPGTKLPSERELSEMLAVSRNILREALSALSAEGIIAKQVGRGTFVEEFDKEVALASLSGSSELTFWLVVVSAVSWRVLKDGIDKPGLLLLYQALPPEPRLRTQSLVETMTDACATGLAGGLILTLSSAPWFGAAPIAGVTALLALVWVGLTRRLVRLHDARRTAKVR